MSHILVHATPVVTAAGVYHVGDAVGGKLEFENARTPYESGGYIIAAHVHDKDGDNANLFLVLFDRDFTPTDDHAEFAVSDADLANVIAGIEFANADYIDFKDNSVCQADLPNNELPFVLKSGETSLFGQLYVTANVATYAATDDLHVDLIIK